MVKQGIFLIISYFYLKLYITTLFNIRLRFVSLLIHLTSLLKRVFFRFILRKIIFNENLDFLLSTNLQKVLSQGRENKGMYSVMEQKIPERKVYKGEGALCRVFT